MLPLLKHSLLTSSSDTLCYQNSSSPYACPGTTICTSNYQYCPYLSNWCTLDAPYSCSNQTCVSSMDQCCYEDNALWCARDNSCVTDPNACCETDSSTPIYCEATGMCVANQYECCSNYYATSSSTFSLKKCTYEPKCAVADNSTYCFTPTMTALAVSSSNFSYQCDNSGTFVQ